MNRRHQRSLACDICLTWAMGLSRIAAMWLVIVTAGARPAALEVPW
jgi:hypothetical protein